MGAYSTEEARAKFLGSSGTSKSTQKVAAETGHTILSPRDSSGQYTSDLTKTTGYVELSQEAHAKEIAVALKSESNVPVGIVQTVAKKLGINTDKYFTTNPPTGITNTTRITGDDTVQNRNILTGSSPDRLIAMGIATLFIVVLLFKLEKTRV